MHRKIKELKEDIKNEFKNKFIKKKRNMLKKAEK